MDSVSLNDHFAEALQLSSPKPLAVSKCSDILDDFQFSPLSTSHVLKMLKSLKINTATGSDELSARLLKELAPAVAPNLTKIINISFSSGQFPKLWKEAIVSPIWKKKGSKSDPSNYRPISVLPVLARMVEKEAARQLSSFCEVRQIIPPEQLGFRAKSSREFALLHLIDGWMKDID